jgi:hypothetical protein
MAARKRPEPRLPGMTEPRLATGDDGLIAAEWPVQTVRFLLDDGRTVDVTTAVDDSRLREALLVHVGAEALMGSVVLERRYANGDPPPPATVTKP